jgi:hypothetical protein
MRSLWLHRPLLNWRDIYAWGMESGIRKMMPPDQLHVTLATVREPCEWDDLVLQDDDLVVPAGHKPVQIFGFTAKGLAFADFRINERHGELVRLYPAIDHPRLRPHVTLFRGGKMPKSAYLGELVFGPEVATEFSEEKAKGIKHVRLSDYA